MEGRSNAGDSLARAGVLGFGFVVAFAAALTVGEFAGIAHDQARAIAEDRASCKWASPSEAEDIVCIDTSVPVDGITYVERVKIEELERRAHTMTLYSAASGVASLVLLVGAARGVSLYADKRNDSR